MSTASLNTGNRARNTHDSWRIDVSNVGSDTRGETDVKQAQLSDEGVVLEEQGQLWHRKHRAVSVHVLR